MRCFAALLFLALASCAPAPRSAPVPSGPLGDFAWLSGSWIETQGDQVTEEQWMSPRGDILPGQGRTTRAGKVLEWEHVRLEARGTEVFYIADPSGQKEAAFTLISRGNQRAVFEDPTHDYPQRLIYERVGDHLHARIEQMDGGKAHLWDYSPHAPLGSLDQCGG